MYAIVQTGGKQYRVSEGDIISVERLRAEVGTKVVLDEVLAIGDNDGMFVGKPFLEGASVIAELLENGKGEKLIIYKYKAKKDYSRKQGHRQPYSKLRIESISASGASPAEKKAAKEKAVEEKPSKKPAEEKLAKEKAAKKPAEEKPAKEKAEEKPAAAKGSVNLKAMRKAELVAYAQEHGIELNPKATNAEMIATIEAAM